MRKSNEITNQDTAEVQGNLKQDGGERRKRSKGLLLGSRKGIILYTNSWKLSEGIGCSGLFYFNYSRIFLEELRETRIVSVRISGFLVFIRMERKSIIKQMNCYTVTFHLPVMIDYDQRRQARVNIKSYIFRHRIEKVLL